MAETVDLVVENVKELVTLAGSEGPRRGRAMRDVQVIQDGAVAISSGRIAGVGTRGEIKERWAARKTIDARGKVVLPGFVDPHTHLPWVGSREDEFARRIEGATYADIARAGGGILKTASATRAATTEQIVAATRARLDRMLAHGTTTAEAKSGYGLDLEAERRQLEAVKELGREGIVDLVPTNMAAHEVPPEFREDRAAWIAKLEDEVFPALRPLAEFVDVFCEAHVFTVEETRRLLTRARALGYKLKVHADELEPTGGAELAAEMGCVSADHLGRTGEAGVKALAASSTVAVLLPGTSFYLDLPHRAPARALIDAGAAVALATDLNPGSCLTESMPMILTIACVELKMTPAEAVTAATINAAYAVGRGKDRGSLEFGKWADLVIWDVPSWTYIPTHFGVSLVSTVIRRGRMLYRDGEVIGRRPTARTGLTDQTPLF